MSEVEDTTIRVYGDTYRRLAVLREEGESVREVVERILPDETFVIERPESDVVAVRVDPESAQQINSMAGENVTANDVIEHLLERCENGN